MGEPQEKPTAPEKPAPKPVVQEPAVPKPAAKPGDVKIEQKLEGEIQEEKPVANKITVGHVHMSGCTGCLVSLADNYEGLFKILDDYADLVYALTLVDVRHVPEMDVALVEGSVCIQDETAVEEIRETRKKAKVVVALGGCASYGNITRFCRGGQWNQPQHESYLPIGDLIDVDVVLPGCPPGAQAIRNTCVMAYLLLRGTDEQKALAAAYLTPLMNLAKRGTEACGCDLMIDVINQGLCMGCGTCAASCPVRAISMAYGKPAIDRDMCIKCGACYAQCPRSFFNFDVINEFESITELIGAAMGQGGE
ncbi:MAG: coenzyme F420 hydrogenase subunit gamma [Methanomicrobiales archaeon]|nr:coenzyme F420 hydrogenase subunit gamma [Methanomicrobiales archaeon]